MPSIKEMQQFDLSNYRQVDSTLEPTIQKPDLGTLQPTYNPVLRCPIPPIYPNTPDSQRQYYIGGIAPQIRLMPPVALTSSSGSVNTTENVLVNSSSDGSGGGSTPVKPVVPTPVPIVSQSTSVVTPTLNSGDIFTNSLAISRSFQLLSVSASSFCRFELYGTVIAQNSDFGRTIDVPPFPGTTQNLITDVVLDTAPFQFYFQNRMGANGDSPQNPVAYVTITNLDLTSDIITVVLTYVALES